MPKIGQTLSHFRLVEKIGQGGMGEVYLADDTTLDRKVALKFLPEAFTSDPERMARFEREAKLLASLNHPNIAGIHGLEQADGNRFLVLEYVEGETLQARLIKGALPLEDALALCRQIAEGLEAAHEKGVIHRDLKPANVMITAEEKVKILDFGLAKALSDETQSIDSSQSPTLTEAMTRPGVILGTAAYMSPEQAKGKSVDKRADIWAFGCILYECLTGNKAFAGETVTEMLAAVIKEEPDIEKVPAKTRSLLQRCLVKDPKKRLRDISDAMLWIEGTPETSPVPTTKRPVWIWISATLLLCVGTAVAMFSIFSPEPGERQVKRLTVLPPEGSTNVSTTASISPDGKHIAIFAQTAEGKSMLYVRQLDSLEAKPLIEADSYSDLAWSPDSRYIAYGSQAKLKKVDLSEGHAIPLCDSLMVAGGSWNENGDILFADGLYGPIYRTSERGDTREEVTTVDENLKETGHAWPHFLPDNRHFLYLALGGPTNNWRAKIGSLDSNKSEILFPSTTRVIYANPGYLLYVRESDLMARPFDPDSLEPYGQEKLLAAGVATNWFDGMAGISVSQSDILVYTMQSYWLGQLQLYDRQGILLNTFEPSGYYTNPALSFDGNLIAVDKTGSRGGVPDIFTINLTRPTDYSRFTYFEGDDSNSLWSPDGKSLLFSSLRGSARDLFSKNFSGTEEVELLQSADDKYVSGFSRDGKLVLFTVRTKNANPYDLWVLDLSDENKAEPYLDNKTFDESFGQFSPDGKWVVYVSNEADQDDIYVQSFPKPGISRKISKNGGWQPRWIDREIIYLAPDHKIISVPVETSTELVVGSPVELFDAQLVTVTRNSFDVSSDGQRFLVVGPAKNRVASPIVVLSNWTSLLNK